MNQTIINLTGTDLVLPFFAEMAGMFLLILLGNSITSTCILKGDRSNSDQPNWLLIGIGWFAGLTLGVVVAMSIYGYGSELKIWPSLNPVLSIDWMIKQAKINEYTSRTIVTVGFLQIFGQILGALIAQLCVIGIFKKQLDVTEDQKKILACFANGPREANAKSPLWGFFAEMVGTFALVFVIFWALNLGWNEMNNNGLTYITMISSNRVLLGFIIGFALFGIGISIGATNGFSLNPTRDFIPRLLHTILPIKNKGSSNWSFGWIPNTAPFVGGLLALLVTPGLFIHQLIIK